MYKWRLKLEIEPRRLKRPPTTNQISVILMLTSHAGQSCCLTNAMWVRWNVLRRNQDRWFFFSFWSWHRWFLILSSSFFGSILLCFFFWVDSIPRLRLSSFSNLGQGQGEAQYKSYGMNEWTKLLVWPWPKK